MSVADQALPSRPNQIEDSTRFKLVEVYDGADAPAAHKARPPAILRSCHRGERVVFYIESGHAPKSSRARPQETKHYAVWRDTVADWMAEPRSGSRCVDPFCRTSSPLHFRPPCGGGASKLLLSTTTTCDQVHHRGADGAGGVERPQAHRLRRHRGGECR